MRLPFAFLLVVSSLAAAIEPLHQEPRYYWKITPVGKTAEVVTLFCGSCQVETDANHDTPLLAVLRDTLGDSDPENDRISCLWLLTYSRPNVRQRILSAVPFFYWSLGKGSQSVSARDAAPLIDLSAPEHPVVSELGRDILQWTVFDPMATPVRAASRAYRTNQVDDERLHLEEAICYLQKAPVSDSRSALARKQVDTIVARLELRKHVLGGLVNQRRATQMGVDLKFEEERIRSRNWELLRQCADKTGLIFEPLDVAGERGQYGMLWFPLRQPPKPVGSSAGSIWRLLNIKDAWNDQQLRQWNGMTFKRSLDEHGSLLPVGVSGVQLVALIPLSFYSLNYPKLPLLLVDFRHKQRVRRHEMIQRAVTELTAGVLGISHFTNWYYYLGLIMYEFVAARHGSPENQGARLDAYSRFRVALALDRELDPRLRTEILSRVDTLTVNPLIDKPTREIQVSTSRYVYLHSQAEENGRLEARLDDERRHEIASFGETAMTRVTESVLYSASLGLYNHRTSVLSRKYV